MNVVLTIDVECYSGDYLREVWGHGKGLDFILAKLKEYGVCATFFVETLGATRWGQAPVKEICRHLLDAGQEVQLHIHPVVARIHGFADRSDILWRHPMEVQEMLIERGLEALRGCGVKGPTAFRAGDFAADTHTLAVMERLGIWTGSNRDLDGKCSTRSHLNEVFPVRNDLSRRQGVMDLPVTVFRSALPWLDGPYRHFEISAVGFLELTDALARMAGAGYRCATVLTHPGEFFRMWGRKPMFIHKNCSRFESLLHFLSTHRELQVQTISDCVRRTELAAVSLPIPTFRRWYSMLRVCEQLAARIGAKARYG